ncbi:MAG: ChbG/HpnK family deacetylase, partial [Acidobacteriaceae bacterium]
YRPAFLRLVREAGIATTSGTIGVLATGTADPAAVLRRLLAAVPPSDEVWELVCHPGYPDAALDQVRTRLRASRAQEHAALLEQIPGGGVPLGSWRRLEGHGTAGPRTA